ncbi:MAG: family 10 glycosylhydrolase [Tannerellaceae bacterium]|jgi:hypothetical protein|nr:family 10 glycosylhydrolase [Tannerellaceae bacterium]
MRKEACLCAIVATFALCVAFWSCSEDKRIEVKEYPMFWTWLDYNPATFDSICAVMQEMGIDGLMLNAATPDAMQEAVIVAETYGIDVYAWLWILNLDHAEREYIPQTHPDWLSVNRLGWSLADSMAYVKYYKFLCPVLPEVRSYVLEKVHAFCEVEGLKGVAIDYNRLVDVILPTKLWDHYKIMQDKDYPEWDYGYHSAMIEKFMSLYGYDPCTKEDPTSDEVWLQFRCDQVTEVANEIAEVVHSCHKVMAASPFPTPGMARQLVRQDWGKWDLDIVFPMVYHSFYTGDKSFISDCMIKNMQEKGAQTDLYCGILLSPEDSTKVLEYMDEALSSGAEGIAIFTVESVRSPEVRTLFRTYADKMREKRAIGAIPVVPSEKIVIDPFKKEGVMQQVHDKMADYSGVKSEDLQLGEYALIEEYGSVKHYRVTEVRSGMMFDVWFFFHGEIVSGWVVKPLESLAQK